jgi:hypothetical protein
MGGKSMRKDVAMRSHAFPLCGRKTGAETWKAGPEVQMPYTKNISDS